MGAWRHQWGDPRHSLLTIDEPSVELRTAPPERATHIPSAVLLATSEYLQDERTALRSQRGFELDRICSDTECVDKYGDDDESRYILQSPTCAMPYPKRGNENAQHIHSGELLWLNESIDDNREQLMGRGGPIASNHVPGRPEEDVRPRAKPSKGLVLVHQA